MNKLLNLEDIYVHSNSEDESIDHSWLPKIPIQISVGGKTFIEDEYRREELCNNIIKAETQYEEDECMAEIDGVPFLAKKDIVCIKAKQKHGKSTALAILCSALIRGEWYRIKRITDHIPTIIYIDTEMKDYDTSLLQKKTLRLAGKDENKSLDNVHFVNIRKLTQKECKKNIEEYLFYFRPDLLIIDGIVDLLTDFNDVSQSQELIREIMTWAERFNCCIVTVIHTNKSTEDHNMRGHLGTLLSQKCSVTFECSKDKKTNIITVSSDDCRHAPIGSWAFGFDEDGYPINRDNYIKEKEEASKRNRDEKNGRIKEDRKKTIVCIVKEAGESGISRNDLSRKAEEQLSLGKSTISPYITELITEKRIVPKGYNGNLIVNEQK